MDNQEYIIDEDWEDNKEPALGEIRQREKQTLHISDTSPFGKADEDDQTQQP